MAREKVESIDQSLAEIKSKFETLQGERMRLERIRRIAPSLRGYSESSLRLAAMGDVVCLPAEAGKLLADTDSEVAVAKAQQDISFKLVQEGREKLNAISVNANLIRESEAIDSLAERRQQTTFHERDIGKRELEIDGLWNGVQSAVRQLGWGLTDEESLEKMLPPLPIRRAIAGLIKQHGGLEQALSAAIEAERTKRREIADNETSSTAI